jgi:hypothetical protein
MNKGMYMVGIWSGPLEFLIPTNNILPPLHTVKPLFNNLSIFEQAI